MNREIGENVRIKSDLIVGCVYDEFYFVDTMQCYLGIETTITNIGNDGIMRIAADSGRWYWTEAMFEESLENKAVFYDSATIERLARNGPITVQRFEGGWKVIEVEDKSNENE